MFRLISRSTSEQPRIVGNNGERHVFARLEFQIMMEPVARRGLMDDLWESVWTVEGDFELFLCELWINKQKFLGFYETDESSRERSNVVKGAFLCFVTFQRMFLTLESS